MTTIQLTLVAAVILRLEGYITLSESLMLNKIPRLLGMTYPRGFYVKTIFCRLSELSSDVPFIERV